MTLKLRKVRPLVPETNPQMEYQLRTHAGDLFKFDATCFKRSDDDEESALRGLWKKIRELRSAGTDFELVYHDGVGVPWLITVTGQR
jgi:hypothetical protein